MNPLRSLIVSETEAAIREQNFDEYLNEVLRKECGEPPQTPQVTILKEMGTGLHSLEQSTNVLIGELNHSGRRGMGIPFQIVFITLSTGYSRVIFIEHPSEQINFQFSDANGYLRVMIQFFADNEIEEL